MKKNLLWGLAFIAAAILLILNIAGINFGLPENLPIWKIIISVAFLAWIIEQLTKKNFALVFFPLAFIVMIYEAEIAHFAGIESGDLASTWTILLIALLLTIGMGLLTKEFSFTIQTNGEKRVYTGKEAKKKYKELRESNSVYYIDCSEEIDKTIELSIGKAEVFFTNADLYSGNGKIEIENNLGNMIFHIPENWYIDCNIDNSLGSVKFCNPQSINENTKRISITGSNNLGKVEFLNDKN